MVGVFGARLVGLLALAIGSAFPLLAWYVWDERSRPAVQWFFAVILGGLGWCFTNGVALLVTTPSVTEALVWTGYFFAGLGLVGWLAIVFEYVTGTRFPRWLIAVLLVPTVTEQVFAWRPSTRYLVHASGSYVDDAGVFHVDQGLFYLLVTGYYLVIIFCVVGMLIPACVRSEGSRRRQSSLLLVATLVFVVSGVVTAVVDLEPFHPFFVTFPLATGILAHALVNYRLFEVTPVGRETTVREMEDAVVILDSADVVTDANPAARALFGVTDADIGAHATDVFAAFPPLLEALERASAFQKELTLQVDGTEVHFDVRVTGLARGDWQRGRVMVLRDVTPLKRREQELELLKQVFVRVFRHNVRNELTVLKGYAEIARERGDESLAPHLDEVIESSDRIWGHSEKAQVIERVVSDADLRRIDLSLSVERSVASATEGHDDISIERTLSDELFVTAHSQLETAIEELVENAIVHAPDRTTPTIHIHTETVGRTVVLVVEDESGGIDRQEIEILEEGTEHVLKHGSGVGLWLVRFVVNWSNGTLEFETTDDGTRVQITLPLAQTRQSVRQPA